MLKKILKLDWILLSATLLLLIFGLLAIYSLSRGGAIGEFSFYQKQLSFIILGVIVFFLVALSDYDLWKLYARPLYFLGIFLLILVLLIGHITNGATSWFSFGFLKFQPVELVKVGLIMVLALYFSRLKNEVLSWKDIFLSLGYVIPPLALVALQPDYGSAIILLVIWLGMVFLAGIGWQKLLALFLILILTAISGWFFFLRDYQKERILTFFDPTRDSLGSGYNVIQAIIAVGSGGWKGKGLGNGSQSQLNFIPEQHTDFIFSTIAEESGFLGVSLMLVIFLLLFWRLKKIALLADTRFGSFLVDGTLVLFFFQFLINVGMNIGLVPVTGLSLPFISYGGSFLLVTMFLVGLAESVYRKSGKYLSNF